MFKKLVTKWKSEWLERQKESLTYEFEGDIAQFKKSLDDTISDMDEKKQKLIQSNKDELLKLEKENHDLKKILLGEQQDIEIKRIGHKTETLKIQSELSTLLAEYESKKSILLSEHKADIQRINAEHDSEVSIIKKRIASKNSILGVDEKEVDYLKKIVDDKKSELESLNNNLRTQIKVIEAKAHPSAVWEQAFTAGFNKAWDMTLLQQEGIEKVKQSIEDKAIQDTLRRINGDNKKVK